MLISADFLPMLVPIVLISADFLPMPIMQISADADADISVGPYTHTVTLSRVAAQRH